MRDVYLFDHTHSESNLIFGSTQVYMYIHD